MDNFWQTQWNTIWEWFGNNEFNVVVWGTFIITTATYWIVGLCSLFFDLTGRPDVAMKYRIQKTSSYPVALNEVFTLAKQVLLNQFLCGIPAIFLFYHLMAWRGYNPRTLPTIQKMTSDFLLFIFVEEIVFYYAHRFLHVPLMFRHVHKIHHKWNSPIAITAAYCHPIEHICSNMLPILFGPFLLGSHLATMWLWFSVATVSTMISHSGFRLPLFPNPEFHDLHHSKFNRNYGVIGLMDRLHGTNG